ADGGPLDKPHLAFVPLASIGHSRADGSLLGIGIVLPSDVGAEEHREAFCTISAAPVSRSGPLGPAI
ncbi:MAG: hypothetical protein RMK02_11105, partial [Burkholderiales bacterium]|nr:hypothetical protein [Burkholderiales bacterium]